MPPSVAVQHRHLGTQMPSGGVHSVPSAASRKQKSYASQAGPPVGSDQASTSCLARLAGNVLMAVQDYLGGEGRVAADLDRQMAPVGIENVKGIVVDVRGRRLSFDVVVGADGPNQSWCPTDQDQK